MDGKRRDGVCTTIHIYLPEVRPRSGAAKKQMASCMCAQLWRRGEEYRSLGLSRDIVAFFRIMQVFAAGRSSLPQLLRSNTIGGTRYSSAADDIGKGEGFDDVVQGRGTAAWLADPLLLNDVVESGWERRNGSINPRCG